MSVTVMQGTGGAAQGAQAGGGAGTPQAPVAPPAPQTAGEAAAADRAARATDNAMRSIDNATRNLPRDLREQLRNDLRQQIRNSVQNGTAPVINLPPDFVRNAVPTGAVQISIAFFVTIAAMVIFTPLARAAARRSDAKIREAEETARNLHPQLHQLQESVDAMAIELERISEAQRFQAKLLAGKEPARVER